MKPGDTVTFEHPTTGKPVVGKLVAIKDGFYIVDDGGTRPLHRLPVKYAPLFNFRAVPEQSSHAE